MSVAALVAALVVVWMVSLAVNPWKGCPACGGSGRHALSARRVWGNCWLCGGSGRRYRFGARMVRRAVRRKEQ